VIDFFLEISIKIFKIILFVEIIFFHLYDPEIYLTQVFFPEREIIDFTRKKKLGKNGQKIQKNYQ